MALPELTQIQRLIEQGGPIVLALIALSVAALTVTLLKGAQFLRRGVGRDSRAVRTSLEHWRAGRHDQAIRQLGAGQTALAGLTRTAMVAIAGIRPDTRPDARNRADAILREDLEARALAHIASLRSHLRVLEAASQLAPLIGLFGTVIGMMSAFQALQSAGAEADPSALAGGIWTALITTAVGLAVAIPAAFVLYWFEGRIAREQTLIETSLTGVLTATLDPAMAPLEDHGDATGGVVDAAE